MLPGQVCFNTDRELSSSTQLGERERERQRDTTATTPKLPQNSTPETVTATLFLCLLFSVSTAHRKILPPNRWTHQLPSHSSQKTAIPRAFSRSPCAMTTTSAFLRLLALCAAALLLPPGPAGAQALQNPRKKAAAALKANAKGQCCEDVRALKVQVANLSSLLEELTRTQDTVVRQMMDLDSQNRVQEARVTEAESKYSEINNRVDIIQLQASQSLTQTSSGKSPPSHLSPLQRSDPERWVFYGTLHVVAGEIHSYLDRL